MLKLNLGKKHSGKLNIFLILRLLLGIVGNVDMLCAVICAVHAVFVFYRGVNSEKNEDRQSYGYLVATAIILAEGATWLTGGRVGMIICLIALTVTLVFAMTRLAVDSKREITNETLMLGFYAVYKVQYLTFFGASMLHIGLVCGAIALVVSVVVVIVKKKEKIKDSDEKPFLAIVAISLVVAVVCAFGSVFVVKALNYALDNSSPTEYEVIVKDKWKVHHRKGADQYLLTADLLGREIDIEVHYDIYNSIDISDAVKVDVYTGAFGYSYLIPNAMNESCR